jgi:hypothetical protein
MKISYIIILVYLSLFVSAQITMLNKEFKYDGKTFIFTKRVLEVKDKTSKCYYYNKEEQKAGCKDIQLIALRYPTKMKINKNFKIVLPDLNHKVQFLILQLDLWNSIKFSNIQPFRIYKTEHQEILDLFPFKVVVIGEKEATTYNFENQLEDIQIIRGGNVLSENILDEEVDQAIVNTSILSGCLVKIIFRGTENAVNFTEDLEISYIVYLMKIRQTFGLEKNDISGDITWIRSEPLIPFKPVSILGIYITQGNKLFNFTEDGLTVVENNEEKHYPYSSSVNKQGYFTNAKLLNLNEMMIVYNGETFIIKLYGKELYKLLILWEDLRYKNIILNGYTPQHKIGQYIPLPDSHGFVLKFYPSRVYYDLGMFLEYLSIANIRITRDNLLLSQNISKEDFIYLISSNMIINCTIELTFQNYYHSKNRFVIITRTVNVQFILWLLKLRSHSDYKWHEIERRGDNSWMKRPEGVDLKRRMKLRY